MSGETSIRNAKASDVVVAPDFPVEASASLPAEWQNSNSIAALIRRHTQGWLITSTNVASIGTRPDQCMERNVRNTQRGTRSRSVAKKERWEERRGGDECGSEGKTQ